MLIRSRPASRSARATGASRMPLVVSPMSLIPGIAASFSTKVGRSRRTSGSPPVSRTLSIPRVRAIRTNRSISSKLKSEAARQELDLLGHAVNAADVAAVGHADPQVVVRHGPKSRRAGLVRVSSRSRRLE